MSNVEIIFFVEGGLDIPFYERLCAVAIPGRAYQVRRAVELPWAAAGGGKRPLLEFHAYLRRANRLRSVFKNKTTTIGFFLDKDVDDLTRRGRRCPHLCYTDYYNVENYLYVCGDLLSAIEVSFCISRSSATAAVGSPSSWRHDTATHWIAWVEFCLLNTFLGAGMSSWSGTSPFHKPHARGALDVAHLSTARTSLATRSGVLPAQFAALERKVQRLVARRAAARTMDGIFSGKWYTHFLSHDAEHGTLGAVIDKVGAKKLESCLLATLDFNAPWAERLRNFAVTLAQ